MTTDNDKGRNGIVAIRGVVRQRSVPHPRVSLKQAEEFARIIYKEGARRCDQENIARKAGYTGTKNSSYFTLKATAQQFGMVIADSQTISLTEEWINVFLHDDRQQLGLAREKAMNQPDFFFQAEDGIRDLYVTGVQTCALPI